jgi:hypothetical protein
MTKLPRLAFARLTAPPPADTLAFFDGYFSPLGPDTYTITVTHAVDNDQATPVSVTQQVTITAPEFSIDAGLISSVYPPIGAVGAYGDDLPYVVVADPALPWERSVTPGEAPSPASAPLPWLALAVFADDEVVLAPGTSSPVVTTTVGALLTPDPAIQKPVGLTVDETVAASQCATIIVTGAAFTAVLPLTTELPLVAHGQADQTTAPPTLVSVVIANRLAVAPTGPVRYHAHLVSLEGLAGFLGPNATPLPTQPGSDALVDVQLVSLFGWTFTSTPAAGLDFAQLAAGLVSSEVATPVLALPVPSDADLPAEVAARLSQGFVPMAAVIGDGDRSYAWYRGPLTAAVPQPVAAVGTPPVPVAQATSADALTIYLGAEGVFDQSYAAAWNLGRNLALADGVFADAIVAARCATRTALGTLARRRALAALAESDDPAADLAPAAVSRAAALQVGGLGQAWTAMLGEAVAAGRPETGQRRRGRSGRRSRPDPRAALASPGVAAALGSAAEGPLATVAAWLARLARLESIPFDHLVPDLRMLPPESIRFAYVDPTWLAAASAGATSLALHGTADRAIQAALAPWLAAQVAAARATAPPVAAVLIRSQMITAWPGLVITASAAGAPVAVVRDDVLAPGVRLVLFAAVPDTVSLAQPYRGLRFGVEDGGQLAPRVVNDPATTGALIAGAAPVTVPLRTPATGATGGVLDLASLIPSLVAATGVVGFASDATVTWNGAALAVQVVSATELIATVPAASLATAGTATVQVTTGGITSAAWPFTITDPAAGPTAVARPPRSRVDAAATTAPIVGLVPTSAPAGSPDLALAILGGFGPGALALQLVIAPERQDFLPEAP